MTRKHFEAIARAINTERQWAESFGRAEKRDGIEAVAFSLSHTLGEFSSAFDRDKFIKACGF